MSISPLRVALVAGGGALLAAWLAAATNAPREAVAERPPPPAVDPPAQREGPASSTAAGLAADLERLRRREEDAPALQVSDRNPFSLAAPPPLRETRRGSVPERIGRRSVTRPPGRVGPAHNLIGVASRHTDAAPERIGILTAPDGDVLLVGTGDRVPGGYLVDAVEPSSVTLVDGAGMRHRLVLP